MAGHGLALGFALAGIGLIGFLVGAIQVYGSKLLRRGAVTGGLYRWVRHPQYLCLAILGFGVTLIWPRFLVVVSYVAMMFLYYALARFEERDCVRKFGAAYIEYQRKTGLIFPRLARRDGAIGLPQGAGASRTFALYTMTTLVAVGVGFGLRSLSLSRVSSAFDEDVAILSPAVIESSDLRHAYRLASGDLRGSALTSSESKLLVYVVPGDWFLPDLPIHTEAEIREVGGGHATPAAATRVYRVLIARPRLHDRTASGKDVVLKAYGLEPLGIARVDLDAGAVVRWDETPEHVIWGDIPTPLF